MPLKLKHEFTEDEVVETLTGHILAYLKDGYDIELLEDLFDEACDYALGRYMKYLEEQSKIGKTKEAETSKDQLYTTLANSLNFINGVKGTPTITPEQLEVLFSDEVVGALTSLGNVFFDIMNASKQKEETSASFSETLDEDGEKLRRFLQSI